MMSSLRRLTIAALTLTALGAGTGMAVAMWMDHGDRLFMTMVQTGLAWCL